MTSKGPPGKTSKFNVLGLEMRMTGGRRYSRFAFSSYSLDVIPAGRQEFGLMKQDF